MKNLLEGVSIIIPAKDEEESLKTFLPKLLSCVPASQVWVVNDGSSDGTGEVCLLNGVNVVTHQYSKGNGAAIKSGARAATGKTLVFMDADGQHNPEDINRLLEHLASGYDMVVGSRGRSSQASIARWLANSIYNKLASWMAGQKIEDLTSGFRAVNAMKFREYIYLLPNGFSYPTTVTMAFYRAGYSVSFLPINVAKRIGRSHISLSKDGVRFLLIIFKIGTLYSPLKIFFPIAISFFMMATGYYAYTLMEFGRFTNMAALLYITSLLVFLIGLVSEQISNLMYKGE